MRRTSSSLCLCLCLSLTLVVVLGCLSSVGTAASAEAPGARPTPRSVTPRKPAPTWTEVTGAGVSVGGTYLPIVGRFDTPTGSDDMIWYAPGTGADHLWRNGSNGAFTKAPLSMQVNGTYTPIVGNFGGSDLEDILWYAPGTAADSLWITTGPNAFSARSIRINGTYTPVVLDDTTTYDELIWQSGTGTGSSIWTFDPAGVPSVGSLTTPPGTRALVGHFANQPGCADVFWYGPGAIADAFWDFNCNAVHSTIAANVKTPATPVVGNFSPASPAYDDLLWYRSGLAASSLWLANGNGTWTVSSPLIEAAGTPLVVTRNWSLVHIWSTVSQDYLWEPLLSGAISYHSVQNTEIPAGYTPIIGAGNGEVTNGGGFIFWYKAGSAPEYYFS